MPEAELHAPDFFYLWPPNHAEKESLRIMRQGKTEGNATEVLVAKEVVGWGTRGRRGGGQGSGLVSDYATYMDLARLDRRISASRTKVNSTHPG